MSFWSDMGVPPGLMAEMDQAEAYSNQWLDDAIEAQVEAYHEIGELSPITLGARLFLQKVEASTSLEIFELMFLFATAINRLTKQRLGIE